MLNELLEILVSLLPARNRSLGSEMRRYRQQQRKRRMKLSDAEYDDILARWTVRTRPGERPATNKGVKMQYAIGVTIYGYIVVEAPSRNDAVEMYAAMSSDQILQDIKVKSMDSEHLSTIRMRGGELWSNRKAGSTAK